MGDIPSEVVKFTDELFSLTTLGYFWFALIAIWGGTASYISRIKKSKMPFSIMELIGEWTIAGFSGVITMYLCMELGMSAPATAAMVGIAGHMGGRAIAMLENVFERRFLP